LSLGGSTSHVNHSLVQRHVLALVVCVRVGWCDQSLFRFCPNHLEIRRSDTRFRWTSTRGPSLAWLISKSNYSIASPTHFPQRESTDRRMHSKACAERRQNDKRQSIDETDYILSIAAGVTEHYTCLLPAQTHPFFLVHNSFALDIRVDITKF
jgi:hypothetical protein